MFKLEYYNESIGETPSFVKNIETGSIIPFDPANTDYQEYLAWLAEGNEPLPPDEPEETP